MTDPQHYWLAKLSFLLMLVVSLTLFILGLALMNPVGWLCYIAVGACLYLIVNWHKPADAQMSQFTWLIGSLFGALLYGVFWVILAVIYCTALCWQDPFRHYSALDLARDWPADPDHVRP